MLTEGDQTVHIAFREESQLTGQGTRFPLVSEEVMYAGWVFWFRRLLHGAEIEDKKMMREL